MVIASQVLDAVGQTSHEQLQYAEALVNGIPKDVNDAVHEPYGARAVIYCLVIDKQPDVMQKQLQQLREFGDVGIYELTVKILDSVKSLDVRYRLPLIDMALPALRQLSAAQYELFSKNLNSIIQADRRIDLFEWSLQKILFRHLDPEFDRPGRRQAKIGKLGAVKTELEILLGMLIHACVDDPSQTSKAFAAAEKELAIYNLTLLSREKINLDSLSTAMDRLAMLKPLLKPRLLKACLAIITLDQEYSASEMELMRAISDVLDCPLPPYVSPAG